MPELEDDRGGRHISVADLYDAHIDEVYRYVYRRCRDHGLAEDVTQDTFLAAVRDERPRDVSIAWLKRVASNRLLSATSRSVRPHK